MRLTILGKTIIDTDPLPPRIEPEKMVEPTIEEPEKKSDINPYSDFGIEIYNRTHAGVTVNANTAGKLDTFYACVRDKAESIGQLPIKMMDTDKKEIISGREHRIFCQKPNDFMTTGDLLANYVTCLETYGRWFAYIVRNKYKNVSQIIPFRFQQQCTVNMDTNGRIYYTYSTNDGKPVMAFSDKEIIHIKLNTLDGFTGLNSIQQCAQTYGLAIGQETHLSSLMTNGAMPRSVLETDNIFSDVDKGARLIADWNSIYSGTQNSGKTALLENGVKHKALSLSPADTQLLEQRIFSRLQICTMLRVPPHRVGVLKAMAYDKLEDNNRAYMRDSLVPIIKKFEDAVSPLTNGKKLKLDTNEFLRGDRLSQVEAVTQEVKNGLASLNEGREALDRQPVEGGDVHAIDTNNLTFGRLEDIPKLQAERLQMGNNPPQPVAETEDED